jgi:hypothetical protein
MNRSALFAAVASAVLAVPGVATAADPYVFATVDAFEAGVNRFTVTGLLVDAQVASSTTFLLLSGTIWESHLRNCQQLALVAMAKPGQYRFVVQAGSSGADRCRLERASP